MATIREKLTVRNLNAIVANLHRVHPGVVDDLQNLAVKYIRIMEARVQQRLPTGPSADHPYSTGFRSEQLKSKLSPSGLVFETGWYEPDFRHEPSGRGVFYPPFPEFGTRDYPASPSLQPSFDETVPEYSADIRAVLRRATKRFNG